MLFYHQSDKPALIDGDTEQIVTYNDLIEATAMFPLKEKSLIFLFNNNQIKDVVTYIAAINSGHVVALFDGKMARPLKENLIKHYQPDALFDERLVILKNDKEPSFGNTTLLLSTSGTTGNPKLIRLSKENLIENALSIIESLKIEETDRAIASLPIHYSYGLSVLHTHLLAHASIVFTNSSLSQQPFWDILRKQSCTSLAGVPFSYKIMERIGFLQNDFPSLRTLTQAGGALELRLIALFHKKIKNFFVMYGQTEATARIACLPPEYLPEKIGSIGLPIPSGKLQIFENDREIVQPNEVGELVYSGPNVALGFANNREDLKKGDELKGVLRTGDLGYFDKDHFFFITGRLNRISKIYGARINLDDIEKAFTKEHVAVKGDDQFIHLFIEGGEKTCEEYILFVSDLFKIHKEVFTCTKLLELPRTASLKIDYKRLP